MRMACCDDVLDMLGGLDSDEWGGFATYYPGPAVVAAGAAATGDVYA